MLARPHCIMVVLYTQILYFLTDLFDQEKQPWQLEPFKSIILIFSVLSLQTPPLGFKSALITPSNTYDTKHHDVKGVSPISKSRLNFPARRTRPPRRSSQVDARPRQCADRAGSWFLVGRAHDASRSSAGRDQDSTAGCAPPSLPPSLQHACLRVRYPTASSIYPPTRPFPHSPSLIVVQA